MFVEFISEYAGVLYTLGTLGLVVFLYGYAYHMYFAQKRGERDYEKYADLALHDGLNDELIEPREAIQSKSK
ncbi:cytochrome c oxidase, cbb3-type, CcoQ subunit [uncultured Helicobacter sp.]|uniref:cytochrome c oxidase, cbb3-type, CcoQ subunit n=1 Tax=uncultured Helicobacter sp. TaxID=175537 RepID=UPI001C39C946|nr:cytochrome c oxidase, cbb3-type, CcoQ subunit [Candidatus Helicobacter avicola]